MRQIILDTETTGLSHARGDRVIEIGAIEMIDRRLTDSTFHHYINPERTIDAQATKIHGITNDFAKDKPLFAEVAQQFLAYVDGAELVIHNAPFDVGFLDFELAKCLPNYKKLHRYCQVFDTLVLARRLHPGQRNNLDALCRRYGVDNTNRDFHGALLDAQILSRVYLAMTGGQASLFGADFSDKKADDQSTQQKKHQPHSLPTLRANEQELALHNKITATLTHSSAAHWDNDE
jgi:DNA polymerase III subunit epsilon